MWPDISVTKAVCGSNLDYQYASSTFNTGGIPYDQVLGRIIGYQFGSTNAFHHQNTDIDTVYVDGVSITHGLPRQHIWSFAAGRAEITAVEFDSICPRSVNSTNGANIPTFVGNNYFCVTGNITYNGQNILYLNDPLWDGQGFNSPLWFNARLPNATTDNIEVRIGASNFRRDEDILLEFLVIYVR